jgi:DNA-directed RNA polymerase specialized sigma24 family protein
MIECLEPSDGAVRQRGVASDVIGPDVARQRVYPAEFDALYRTTRARMVDLALLTTGSRALAEEIVQDVFAELLRRWDGVREPERWLRVAVVNRCTSWVRRRRVERGYLVRHTPTVDAFHDPDTLAAFDLLQKLNPPAGRARAAVHRRMVGGRGGRGPWDARRHGEVDRPPRPAELERGVQR